MHLAEGSIVIVNLVCGCGERRVQVVEGKQTLKCGQASHESTGVEFTRDRDGRFSMRVW